VEKVCQILEQLVAKGTLGGYAVGGATAAGFHGEPLATLDVDVFVLAEPQPGSLLVSLEPVYQELRRLGFSEHEKECVVVHGLPVQFIVASSALEAEALQQAQVEQWEDKQVRVMRPEHLAALALRTGRPKDRARVVYLFSLPQFDRVLFEEIVQSHGLVSEWSRWQKELGLA
jgi:hypothetical protein